MNNLEILIRKLIGNTATEQDGEELKELLNDESNLKEAEKILDAQFKLPRAESDGLVPKESSHMIEYMVRSSERKRFRFRLATAAVVVMMAVAGAWIYTKKPDQVISVKEPEVIFAKGKDHVRLPDGTIVFMNENSELSYSTAKNQRQVFLKGEAYFDVAHDASKPFIVHTGNISTRVLGTAFNVKVYSDQNKVLVSVTRGKVQVGGPERTYAILKANEQLAVNTTDNSFTKENLDTTLLAWKENFLVFDEITLEEAAGLIGKKYGVEIRFDRPQLKRCGIYAKFLNDENLLDVLEVVSGVTGVKYTLAENNRVVVISGKGCN
jgi:transmembrane sensor